MAAPAEGNVFWRWYFLDEDCAQQDETGVDVMDTIAALKTGMMGQPADMFLNCRGLGKGVVWTMPFSVFATRIYL